MWFTYMFCLYRCIKLVLLNGVKGQRRSKFETISNGKNKKVNLFGMDRYEEGSVHGDLFDRPTVEVQRSKKFKI